MVYCLFEPDLKFGFTLPEKGIISELEILLEKFYRFSFLQNSWNISLCIDQKIIQIKNNKMRSLNQHLPGICV